MRTDRFYEVRRLLFALPQVLRLSVPLGRHQPCRAGCVLTVNAAHQVTIEGPHRDAVVDQARRFLRVHARGHGALSIPATLYTPGDCPRARRGSDSCHFVIGAEIAFVFSALAPEIHAA